MAYERSFGLGISIGVRTKLVLSTAAILIVACLLLGCLFFRQQVRSATESLVQSGALLAQHLAGMGRVSILAGDTHRLDQLAQEILAVSPVAYLAIISPSGDLHTGYGKGEWQQQFSAPSTNRRQFSVTKLVSQPKADAGESIINGIWLSRNGPLLRSSLDLSPSELLNLLGGYELPIFYDLLVQVPRQSHTNQRDPALELTLKERPGMPEDTQHLTSGASSKVEIGLSTSELQQNLRRLLWQAILITVSTLIGGVCIVVLLASRMTVPLQALTTAATKLGAGETAPTIAIHARDEIGTLTRVFNSMASTLQTREYELRELAQTLEERVKVRTQELAAANAKLQELDRRKSLFVSTASHELRTPLTSMTVNLANLRDGIDGAVTADQRGSLLRVEANLSRLRGLIEELLDLSQIELGQATLRLGSVELGSVIAKTVEDLHPFTSERAVRIVISLPTDLPPVSADPEKLRQILLNLLHNAVKFSPMDTVVDLNVTRLSHDNVQISIHDVGPGIAPDDVDKVFQPFYRAPTTHKKTKGTGLGLAIAKLLVELHQSRLAVETAPGLGSCFYFTLQTMTPARLTYADPVAPPKTSYVKRIS
ncbi:MAG: HAMP domain-containing histidine kinase [Nitrospira sp.]|nr:HAMP domain-containing histidine kinase [Nitrospira sp.]